MDLLTIWNLDLDARLERIRRETLAYAKAAADIRRINAEFKAQMAAQEAADRHLWED